MLVVPLEAKPLILSIMFLCLSSKSTYILSEMRRVEFNINQDMGKMMVFGFVLYFLFNNF